MRLLKILSGLAGIGLLAFSCGKTVTLSAPSVSFSVSGESFAAEGGSKTVSIKVSNATKVEVKTWTDNTFSTQSDWLSATYDSSTVTLTAEDNSTVEGRSAYVKVVASNSAGVGSAAIKVVQVGGTPVEPEPEPEVTLSEEALSFPAEGGSAEVSLSTNANYLYYYFYAEDLESEAEWLDLGEGATENDFVITASANTGEARKAYFVLWATMEDMDENEDSDYAQAVIVIEQEAGNSGGGGGDTDDPVTAGVFQKITSDSELTSAWYLIVYEGESVAMDGSLKADELDSAGNTQTVTISDGKISADETLAASAFWYDSATGSLKSSNGYYIYWNTSDKNGLDASSSAHKLTISISDGNADIRTSSNNHLRFNASKDQKRFRFFKNSSYTSQKAVQMYKLTDASAVPAFSVSSTVLTAGPKATSASFGISASDAVNWTASSSNADFTLSATEGSGSATITVSFAANTTSESRSTTITVATDNEEVATKSYEIVLTQGPASEGDIDDGTPGYDDNLVPRRKIRLL